jgi:predicted Zn-dependent protease with MMP-like domain
VDGHGAETLPQPTDSIHGHNRSVRDIAPERFEELVVEALDHLPGWVQERLENVEVLIEDEPTAEQARLLGLYEGIPLTERASGYFGVLPDRITLFRPTLVGAAADEEGLRALVADTVVHEIAHFFGISDERLAELGWD